MAAEGYARIARMPAVVNVTTGPGGINALNGVFGGVDGFDSDADPLRSGEARNLHGNLTD